jgi:hypothetical protein
MTQANVYSITKDTGIFPEKVEKLIVTDDNYFLVLCREKGANENIAACEGFWKALYSEDSFSNDFPEMHRWWSENWDKD